MSNHCELCEIIKRSMKGNDEPIVVHIPLSPEERQKLIKGATTRSPSSLPDEDKKTLKDAPISTDTLKPNYGHMPVSKPDWQKKFEEQLKNSISPEKWPKTVEEAVNMTLSSLPEKDKEIIRNTPQKDLAKFHHTLGRWIRNNYGLYSMKNGELLKSCGLDKVKNADEIALFFDHASMVMLEGIWKKLQ